MTISSTTVKNSYSGNSSTTVPLPIPLKFLRIQTFKSSFVLQLVLKPYKTITTHYTVTGAGSANGGSITFLTAPNIPTATKQLFSLEMSRKLKR
jgi:hypothetical protein